MMIASIRGTTRFGSQAAHSAPTHDRHALSRELPESPNSIAQASSSGVMGHTHFGIRLTPPRIRLAEGMADAVPIVAVRKNYTK